MKGLLDDIGNHDVLVWRLRDVVSGLRYVFCGKIKRKRPYMSFVRYYVGKLNLTPRWDARAEDVLSAAMSVHKIDEDKDLRGHKYFYVVFLSSDFRHVLDVSRVFRANGILGTLCYKNVVNDAGKHQGMLALRVRDRNQKFMHDVQATVKDITYYRDTVLPEYNAAHKNKKYIIPELFGRYR